jgi:tetratricopeptide (TPR) repeat protein
MLAMSQQAFGARHPRTIMLRGRQAAACEASGRLDEAIAAHEQTLAELEQTLPPGHPDTGAVRIRLAHSYTMGRNADAVRVAEEALADAENMTGPAVDVLMAHERLARTFLAAGQLNAAAEAYRQVLAGREQILGTEHPQTIAACSAFAAVCRTSGQFKQAITLAERALASSERVLGPTMNRLSTPARVWRRPTTAGRRSRPPSPGTSGPSPTARECRVPTTLTRSPLAVSLPPRTGQRGLPV